MNRGEAASGITIRDPGTHAEFEACVALQEEVWGVGFSERVPVAILKVSRRLGGVVSGAWDASGELVGFVFGMMGWIEGEPVHWSDMLAVRPGLRDEGLGSRLKWHQRRVLMERGVNRVYWTFDPLESRNAYLNLEHLGVVVREYEEDMYGDSDSPLHRGLGTDRFIALWQLDSERVRRRAGEEGMSSGRRPRPRAVPALTAAAKDDPPEPGTPRLELSDPVISVAIPAHIHDLKKADPALARRWRVATREALTHYLSGGWEVQGLERAGNLSRYLLVREGQAGPKPANTKSDNE
jgi:predicted GNAT superfamily acetyltransferase